MPKWGFVRACYFTRKYVNQVRKFIKRRYRSPGGQNVEVPARDEGVPLDWLALKEDHDRFRAILEEGPRGVFDAWVESGGCRSWQRANALKSGRSEAWVCRQVAALRLRMLRFGIYAPDLFVEMCSWYREEAALRKEEVRHE